MSNPSKRKGSGFEREIVAILQEHGIAAEKMEWRPLSTLPAYEVSEYGHVRRVEPSPTRKVGHVLKGRVTRRGYREYKLVTKDGRKLEVRGHVVVCEAWHGPKPSPDHQVAHGDGDRLNNHYSNLRWATSKENHADRFAHGTAAIGSKNGRAILSEARVQSIRRALTGKRGEIARLARQHGVSYSQMHRVCHQKEWGHVGS